MEAQRYIPAVVIGLVVVYALSKLKGGSSPQVYNALLPTSTDKPENRDAARTEGFATLASVGLGQLKLTGEANQLAQAVDLAKQRFSNTIDLAKIQQQGATDRFLAQLGDRAYDRALQERALDQSFALAQTGQVTGGIGQLVAGILNALKPQSQQQRSGGSSGGGVGSPPFNPNANRQQPVTAAQRAASQNAVGRWLDRYRNTGAVSVPDYGYLGEAQGYDLSPWDWLTGYGQEGFDYWQGYYTNADMLGAVSVDYQLTDPYGWTADDYDWFALDPDSFYY